MRRLDFRLGCAYNKYTIGKKTRRKGAGRMENTAYLLRCCDGSYYAGWTNDLPKRVRVHQAGKGAKYTRARLPVELCYYETFATKAEAMRREWQLKQLSHREKAALADGWLAE